MQKDALLVVMLRLLPVGNPYGRLIIGPTRILNRCDLADLSDNGVEVLEATDRSANTPAGEDPRCRIERYDRRQPISTVLARAATEAETAEYEDLQEGIETCGN
jgi:hypothetical protein